MKETGQIGGISYQKTSGKVGRPPGSGRGKASKVNMLQNYD